MDVSNLISHDTPREVRRQPAGHVALHQEQQRLHPYPTRHAVLTNGQPQSDQGLTAPTTRQTVSRDEQSVPTGLENAPASPTPKNVAFELMFEGTPNIRARLPMRVQIFPHDTTDSIVTTVKNFYGLYDGAATGVSFEDDRGNTLIARYENFNNNMVVYVRVIPDYSQPSQPQGQFAYHSGSPTSAHIVPNLEEALQMLPPQPAQALNYGQPVSRPSSRVARKRSPSPRPGRNTRSASVQKGRSRSGIKSREASVHGAVEDVNSDTVNGYSSSDGGAGSVTSSRKARSELASADISLDNILEGGRRKRAKFESSELPLFVPPQVAAPNSISSISPQRQSNGQENPSPFARPVQRPFALSQPLYSPQSYGHSESSQRINPTNSIVYPAPLVQHSHGLRGRANCPPISTRVPSGTIPRGQGIGILPTPDPTVASCISDEDVALQLMRLGDASNISHGRTSASTLDETLSGRADVASSTSGESGDGSDTTEQPSLPPASVQPKSETSPTINPGSIKRHCKHLNEEINSFDSAEVSGGEVDADYVCDEKRDGLFKSDPDTINEEFAQVTKLQMPGPKVVTGGTQKSRSTGVKKAAKPSKPRPASMVKKNKVPSVSTGFKAPISPASLTPQSRKTSSASTLNFQHQLGADEEDLSSKPRCQRCRKSKKGCDRQRPCQRCQDAGIGADGCISEDEGNGRKGRFGRHMGVSVKKESQDLTASHELETHGTALNSIAANPEKSKKRKR
ncbi:hypothetical protein MMC29_004648 [Sticta canariensis]|nr:hypothetical protein [Sticta canariensis]